MLSRMFSAVAHLTHSSPPVTLHTCAATATKVSDLLGVRYQHLDGHMFSYFILVQFQLLLTIQVESFMSGGESPDKLWASLALLTAEVELVTACGRYMCSSDHRVLVLCDTMIVVPFSSYVLQQCCLTKFPIVVVSCLCSSLWQP
jgi:hypothetical protein